MNDTDEELIARMHQAGRESREYQQCLTKLAQRYKKMVSRKARTYYLTGGDYEDLIEEGMIGLYQAANDYDPSRGSSFQTFASLCIDRHLKSVIKASLREKNRILNNAVSYDQVQKGKDGTVQDLKETISDHGDNSPETIVTRREEHSEMIGKLEQRLSPLEKKVFARYLEGYPYTQIAEDLGLTDKSVDNAIQRIKQKASRLEQEPK